MKPKLQETVITKTYKYKDKTVIIGKTTRKDQPIYFSGSAPITEWDVRGAYIDMAPKGNFITRWVKRLWNIKKLEKILV